MEANHYLGQDLYLGKCASDYFINKESDPKYLQKELRKEKAGGIIKRAIRSRTLTFAFT